ncbi:divergent polysaccharide deacetylase family protein [Shewanella aestuarii]|uniref:Divergent polysaccharide deacetylase family protein n=1 Tax=Shewanella aestuarii TaxID=1028752 RepID=A0A6G9QN67_9GAMM|nr:divergent polysaccharide deacetylase family protein [Shewanella aestuarii]QIR16006.1 divergent polysaccharide deacetylase family protein [Shewanella aestuarii]
MRFFLFIILQLVCLSPLYAANLAIIIDDIGYRQTDEAVLSLPPSITLSVLPHTPLGQRLALAGHQKGHEIMLHIPMQALSGNELGPGGLTNDMSEEQVKSEITSAFNNIPFARGANNHMGSLLTQLTEPMQWVMQSLKIQQAYFVDSVTTSYSKASTAARDVGVPLLQRQVFLDNDVHHQALEKQFKQIIQFAKQEGNLVAIAHPYPETVAFLTANLPRLKANGIELVHTSELLAVDIARIYPTSSNQVLR